MIFGIKLIQMNFHTGKYTSSSLRYTVLRDVTGNWKCSFNYSAVSTIVLRHIRIQTERKRNNIEENHGKLMPILWVLDSDENYYRKKFEIAN